MHGSTKCIAAGCNEEEKQEHLVRCPAIRREFWDKVAALMGRLKMNAGSSDLKWLLGIKEDGIKVAARNQGRSGDDLLGVEKPLRGSDASEDRGTQPEDGVRNFCADGLHESCGVWSQVVQMWYSRQHYKIKAKSIPIRFRERKLIDSEAKAKYSLAAPLQTRIYRLLWPATTGPP